MIACLLSCLYCRVLFLTFSISYGYTSVDRQKLNKVTSYKLLDKCILVILSKFNIDTIITFKPL
jgi:hypothetical protein